MNPRVRPRVNAPSRPCVLQPPPRRAGPMISGHPVEGVLQEALVFGEVMRRAVVAQGDADDLCFGMLDDPDLREKSCR